MRLDAAAVHERLRGRFGEKLSAFDAAAKQAFAVVAADAIAEVAAFLKAEPDLAFDNLMCLSAVDYPKETPPRMEVVYHLLSYAHAHQFVVKVHLPREDPRLPGGGLYPLAKYFEARRDVAARLGGETLALPAGERVEMNHSYKYAADTFMRILAEAGLAARWRGMSDDGRFLMVLAEIA